MAFRDLAVQAERLLVENQLTAFIYLTGATRILSIIEKTQKFVPGALGDHLTSGGGVLVDGNQMSILRWIEAGAAGSYGTVLEPCAITEKFPNASALVPFYFMGRTLIESYWASVERPGEGIFVGEPLASPFKGVESKFDGSNLQISATWFFPGKKYAVEESDSPMGPFKLVRDDLSFSSVQKNTFTLQNATKAYYRIVEK